MAVSDLSRETWRRWNSMVAVPSAPAQHFQATLSEDHSHVSYTNWIYHAHCLNWEVTEDLGVSYPVTQEDSRWRWLCDIQMRMSFIWEYQYYLHLTLWTKHIFYVSFCLLFEVCWSRKDSGSSLGHAESENLCQKLSLCCAETTLEVQVNSFVLILDILSLQLGRS
jgi:hypothetical protein